MERFWVKVLVGLVTECWPWTAGLDHYGYGMFRVNGKTVKAHRFAYEAVRGPIPAGLEPDHLCRNRACENPWHMELVTTRVNILRGVGVGALNAVKIHCPQGHPYDDANTYIRPDGSRHCRACARERDSRRLQHVGP